MVDTGTVTHPNGADAPARRAPLPESVTIPLAELQAFPSPGTQRALKAETGRDYMAMVGPAADSADRTQTQIWVHLRKSVPGLAWADCEEISLQFPDGEAAAVDPTVLASFGPSPGSAASGE